jgi:hypothetical protein
MASALNINNINIIRDRWQPSGSSSAPRSGQERSSPLMPVDRVTLSRQALEKQTAEENTKTGPAAENDLNEEQKQQVKELKKRDAEVKSHEQAHMASGGGLVQGGASFEYQSGPDGKMYAVGGEVKIDMSPERTPEATIRKMQQVRRAALAPAEPSGTDRAVAAQASQIEARARMERTQSSQTGDPPGSDAAASAGMTANGVDATATTGDAALGPATGRRIDLVI